MTQLKPNTDPAPVSPEKPSLAPSLRKQRMRSLAIALGLGLLVVLFYLVTIIRLGGNVLNRPI